MSLAWDGEKSFDAERSFSWTLGRVAECRVGVATDMLETVFTFLVGVSDAGRVAEALRLGEAGWSGLLGTLALPSMRSRSLLYSLYLDAATPC